jgi:hypothetical protein
MYTLPWLHNATLAQLLHIESAAQLASRIASVTPGSLTSTTTSQGLGNSGFWKISENLSGFTMPHHRGFTIQFSKLAAFINDSTGNTFDSYLYRRFIEKEKIQLTDVPMNGFLWLYPAPMAA